MTCGGGTLPCVGKPQQSAPRQPSSKRAVPQGEDRRKEKDAMKNTAITNHLDRKDPTARLRGGKLPRKKRELQYRSLARSQRIGRRRRKEDSTSPPGFLLIFRMRIVEQSPGRGRGAYKKQRFPCKFLASDTAPFEGFQGNGTNKGGGGRRILSNGDNRKKQGTEVGAQWWCLDEISWGRGAESSPYLRQ